MCLVFKIVAVYCENTYVQSIGLIAAIFMSKVHKCEPFILMFCVATI